MRGPDAALVGGFWDEATGLGAVAWLLDGTSGGLLAAEGEAKPAMVELDDAKGGVSLRLDAGGTCEAKLAPRASEPALQSADGEAPAGGPTAAVCSASVRMDGADGGRRLECFGHLTRWAANPLASLGSLRHVTMPASEGALLVVTAGGKADAEGHGDEDVSAWLIDPEGRASAFADALLSTQYDEGGRQTRAGLELWPADPDAPPTRAAGTSLGESVDGQGVTAALMRSSIEGTTALGSYLIWRL